MTEALARTAGLVLPMIPATALLVAVLWMHGARRAAVAVGIFVLAAATFIAARSYPGLTVWKVLCAADWGAALRIAWIPWPWRPALLWSDWAILLLGLAGVAIFLWAWIQGRRAVRAEMICGALAFLLASAELVSSVAQANRMMAVAGFALKPAELAAGSTEAAVMLLAAVLWCAVDFALAGVEWRLTRPRPQATIAA